MNSNVLSLVEEIIRESGRDQPADSVLRRHLKRQRGISPALSSEVAHTVFAYFKWYGWTKPQWPLSSQIAECLELAAAFRHRPESFSEADLIAKVAPDWIQEEIQMTPELARALQNEPTLWLRARPGTGPLLAKTLGDCRSFGEGILSDILAYDGRKDLFRTPEFQRGDFELQDISSQAVGLICAPQPGQTWWDACAGEGGKLLHLSDLMQNQGLIWASDRAAWRLRKLKQRAARARAFNYRAVLWNGAEKLPTKTKFDGVLLDAPCSGTGTWQRNPHARWTLTREDVRELAEKQLRLLRSCARAVKPGGRLVYSVCSWTKSETSEVIQAFERDAAEFSAQTIQSPLGCTETAINSIQLMPQQIAGNGMFIACWIRARG